MVYKVTIDYTVLYIYLSILYTHRKNLFEALCKIMPEFEYIGCDNIEKGASIHWYIAKGQTYDNAIKNY